MGLARNCYLRSATLESPHRSRKEYFYRGQEGRQSAWLFIDWLLARKEESSSCWPLIITGYKSSPCWSLCNWGFCLLNFYSSNFSLLPQTYQCLSVVFSSGQKYIFLPRQLIPKSNISGLKGVSLCLYCCCSVAQSYLTVTPRTAAQPGFPVLHHLPEFAQTHVHQVSDAIQPSHPLSSPSPPAFNLSQHQGLSQWVSSSHQVAKVLEFQLQHQSFQ